MFYNRFQLPKTLMFTVLSLLGATGAQSADRRDFWLLNHTGRTIERVYIAAHGTGESWGYDVLGQSTVGEGAGTRVFFPEHGFRCEYDFRIVFTGGGYADYTRGRDLCLLQAVEFDNDTNRVFVDAR
jgi:hypothetical protein